MAITFTSTMPGAPPDLFKYLWLEGSPITKTAKYKNTRTLDFALIPWGSDFVKLTRGAYITVDSTTYPKWFTGYVTNEPDLTFLGQDPAGTKVYGYVYHASADEYVLSLNPVGIVKTFFNTHMGEILKGLANKLCPGLFDLTNIQPGPLVAQYVVDPTRSFYSVAQELCEAGSFVFYGNDHKLYFVPQDDTLLPPTVLDGHDKNFTPSALLMTAASTPVINDATVVGMIEPQTYVTEYFIGTGLTSAFPLIDSVFGADSSVLVQETFGGSSISTQTWNVFDHNGLYLRLLDGYLNCLGGSGNQSYDVSLQTVTPVPMEGNIRFTHGEFDFLGGSGIVGGVWAQAPSNTFAGCLYGIVVNGTVLNPIVNASGDGSQTFTVDTAHRYCIRTIATFSKTNRTTQPFSYLDATGAVKTVTSISSGLDQVTWTTFITEIDPVTGLVTKTGSFVNTVGLTGTDDTFALYVPVLSDTLLCTVTGILVSVPINGSMAMASPAEFNNPGFDIWVDDVHPSGWSGQSADGVAKAQGDQLVSRGLTAVTVSGSALKLFKVSGDPYVAQFVPAGFLPNTAYDIQVRLLKDAGTNGTVKLVLDGTGFTEVGLSVPLSSIGSGSFLSFTGRLTAPIATLPTDLALKIYLTGSTHGAVYVDEVSVTSAWQNQLVGPNEIDAVDGLAPVATVVQPNSGSATSSTYTGTPQYNAGQGVLTFFSDSVTLESNIPASGELVRFSYRSAGAAVGRAKNVPSIDGEAVKWGDNGVRSVVRMDLSPRPRTSYECELAASAVVQENSYVHYQGTYAQRSQFLTTEPVEGSLMKFVNLPSMAAVEAEEINQVVTTLDADSPESFNHTITFGKPDNIQVFLDKVQNPVGSFQVTTDAASPSAIDVRAVGVTHAPDVTSAFVYGWDNNNIYVDAGQALGSGICWEVRYTDSGWGCDTGKNLIGRFTTQQFTVPRTIRSQMFFIRQVVVGNLLPWSEDVTQSPYALTGATVSNSLLPNPDYKTSQVSSVVFSAGGKVEYSVTFPGGNACWSFSIKAPVGKAMTAVVGAISVPFTTTGSWQRIMVPIPGAVTGSAILRLTSTSACTAQLSRYSVESGTLFETTYTRTKGTVYGPTSRYSSAIHIAFPLPVITPAPVPTIIQVTEDTTLVAPSVGDLVVEMNTSGGAFTVTLPPSSSYVGRNISCILESFGLTDGPSNFNATVVANSGDLYNGQSSWTFSKQWQGLEFTGVA